MSLHNCSYVRSCSRARSSLMPLVAILTAVMCPNSGLAAITKGPCPLRVCHTRVTLMWETDTDGPLTIRYGKTGGSGKSVESHTEKVSRQVANRDDAFIHKVWIEDLEPSRGYHYGIASTGLLQPHA
jgi:Purple acid Phosphatase, N-terminal domain